MGDNRIAADASATDAIMPASQFSASVRLFPALLCVTVSLVAHLPYLDAFPTNDDIYLQLEVGYVATGQTGLLEFVGRPYNGQLFSLFKLIYYAFWRLWGLAPAPLHLFIFFVHGISGALIYQLLRRFDGQMATSMVAAIVWSAASIGRWDNPLIWLCAGALVCSVACLLAAVTVVVGPFERWHVPRVVLLGAFVFAALACWSPVGLLVPLVPLTAWASGKSGAKSVSATGPTRRQSWWQAGWFVPLVIFGIWQAGISGEVQIAKQTSSGESVELGDLAVEAPIRTAAVLGQTLASATIGEIGGESVVGAWIVVGLLSLLALWGVLRSRPIQKRFAGVVVLSVGFYLLIASAIRIDVTRDELLAWGRFRYVPMIAWTVIIGVALDGLFRSPQQGVAVRNVAFGALLLGVFGNQYRLARRTADEFRQLRGPYHEVYLTQARLLSHLEETADASGVVLRLPQIPIDLPPIEHVQFPLSSFIALELPRGKGPVRVVAAEQLQPADIESAQSALRRSNNPRAAEWADLVDAAVLMQRRVRWLGTLGRDGDAILLPRNLRIQLAAPRGGKTFEMSLSQFVADGFATFPEGIRFVAPADFEKQRAAIMARIGRNDSDEARYWLALLGRVSQRSTQDFRHTPTSSAIGD